MKNTNFKTKLIALILLLCTVTLMFSSCARKKVDKPADTNLEYWLLDKLDTDGCTELNNILAIDTHYYLAKGYEAEVNEKGQLVAPKYAVIYEVSRYPYGDWGLLWRIGSIYITDPNVSVWGLTINSTREEFVETMTELGFEFDSEDETYITFYLNKNYVSLRYGIHLRIRYDIPMFGTFFF